MSCFHKSFALLFLVAVAALPSPSRAALEPTLDLSSLCFMSTDVVEARLVRHHQAGQGEWNDTFTATVLTPLEGKSKTGDTIQLCGYPLWQYLPAETDLHCLFFLAHQVWQSPQDASLSVVDALLIDSQGRVRRYFQQGNPGPMLAEGYKLDKRTGQVKENDATEQKYPTLASERKAIVSQWDIAKKMKAPPYEVLRE